MIRQRVRRDESKGKLDANVLRLHAIGMQLLQLWDDAKHGSDWIGEQVEQLGESRDTLYRAKQLAEVYYGRRVETLRSLTWAHVKVLLTVRDDEVRIELQRRAIDEEWSKSQLDQVVIQKQGRNPARGGRLQPGSFNKGLEGLTERSRKWLQFVQKVWPPGYVEMQCALSPEAKELAQRLRRTEASMEKLLKCLEHPLPGLEQ